MDETCFCSMYKSSYLTQVPPTVVFKQHQATGDMPVYSPTGDANEEGKCVEQRKWRYHHTMSDQEVDLLLLEIQSGGSSDDATQPESAAHTEFARLLKIAIPRLNAYIASLGLEEGFLSKWLENFHILRMASKRCVVQEDWFPLLALSYRICSGNIFSVDLEKKFVEMLTPEVQATDFESVVTTLRGVFDYTTCVTECTLTKKLVSLYSFMLTQGVLTRFGITLSDEEYSKVEQRALLSAFSSRRSFLLCVIDTTLFVCERVIEWRKTGDFGDFLKSGKSFETWSAEADRLIALAPFTGNLEPHGTTIFSFVADLRNAVEKGEALSRYVRSRNGDDSRFIEGKLAKLKLIQGTELTRKNSQKERKAPFGVLIHGGSSVAKTSFAKMLFHYYGALRGLEHTDDFRYVRSPTDEFWTNYDSSKWCIQFDDLAFLHPSKGEIEPGMRDLIHVAGNTPFNPPQAALEDKGKTPVLAELLTATTNCVDLNAWEYFWCPLAVRRRLPYVVTVEPKTQYLHQNGQFIDPAKLSCEEGSYPDFWIIHVQKVVPVERDNRQNADLETIKTFTNVNEFLQHFGKAALVHNANQEASLVSDVDMSGIEVCKACYAPLPHDVCMELQHADLKDVTVEFARDYWLGIVLFILPYLPLWAFVHYFFSSLMHFLGLFWVGYIGFIFQATCAIYYVLGPRVRFLFKGLVERLSSRATFISFIARCSKYRWGRRAVLYLANESEEKTHWQLLKAQIPTSVDHRLIGGVGLLAIVSALLHGYAVWLRKSKPTEESADVQGAEAEQFQKEASRNVWYNPSIELTKFDIPRAVASMVGKSANDLREIVGRNCVLLHVRGRGENYRRVIRGVMVAGHRCLTNAHAFKEGFEWYTVTVIQSNANNAVNSNMQFDVHVDCIAKSASSDLCIFDVECLPPFRDVLKWWSDADVVPSSCVELMRSEDGSSVMSRRVHSLTLYSKMPISQLGLECDILMGTADQPTAVGDCGALCVFESPKGPYICGIHILGRDTMAGILFVKRREVDALMLHPALSKRPIIQAGYLPVFEASNRKHVLGSLHHKSLARYLDKGRVNVYGSFMGFRPKPKSKVCATPIQQEVLEYYGEELKYGRPAMGGYLPWRNNLIAMVEPKSLFDRRILRECATQFIVDCIAQLPADHLKELVVLSDRAAVNGLPGVKYIDRLNINTSMGFPWCTSKKGFLIEAKDDEYPEGVDFTPEIWAIVRKIEDLYRNGTRANPIFFGSLKDEARKWEKISGNLTRMFMAGPAAWGVVVRKYLLPFVRLVQRNRNVFGCAVGLPAQSEEWGDLRAYLTQHGDDRMVAGDYKNFDKEMLAEFMLEAFRVIIEIHRHCGASEEVLTTIAAIGEDISFPICNVNGDLYEFFGSNPSGQPLTVILNSFVNVLYLRYTYRVLNPEQESVSFVKNVAATTYGDDNAFGVSKSCPWYNHTSIQAALKEIGLTYTMADKSSESVPYIHIDEVTFLKRSWRWDEHVEAYLCPLEEESIIKSLTVWTPSETLDQYKHLLQVVTAASNEYFFYGREVYEKRREFFSELLKREPYCFYAKTTPLPTYDHLAARFKGFETTVGAVADSGERVELLALLKNPWLFNNDSEETTRGSGNVEAITTSIAPSVQCKVTAHDVIETYQIQSDDVQDTQVGYGGETVEVVTFIDNSSGQIEDIPREHSELASSGATQHTSLGDFLRRPTKIDTRTWTTATSTGVLGTVLQPWFDFLNNPVIRDKLNNFAFIRGTLCLKVIVNATPFHYGLMRVAYEPNVNAAGTGDRVSKIRTNPTSALPLITPYSQLPGVWVVPADDSGGELRIPFFRHTNWLPLKNASSLQTMGTLTYYTAFPLSVATTSGSTSITVTTFAWLEDVELSGSTAELTLQARDEYSGPVSAPARAVATAANALSSLPVIGKFAKATSIGAGALASVASLFGFTNTPVIDNVHAVVPVAGIHLASSEIGTPVQKLSLDPKQELSIDPTMHGLSSCDEMSIDYIAKKKSTLVMDGWSTTDGVGTVIFNARVSPMLFGRVEILDGGAVVRANRVYHTSLSYLGMMFQHWRGDIVFEIEVVCTKFHKGRLKIAWDPIGSGGTVALDENTVYTTILDIGENNKATIRVPYHQAYGWLRTRGVTADNWSPGNAMPTNAETDNGLMMISVLTPLMSPVTPQNVGVKISVYSADVEFANPRSALGDSSTSAPPSFFAIQAKDVVDVEASSVSFGDKGVQHAERYALNFGERVASLRTLLHRYSLYDTTSVPPDAATRTAIFRKSYSRHPPMFGFDPNGWTNLNKALTAGTAFGTVSPTHPITYVEMMYGASTGSVNFIVNPSVDLYPYLGDVRIQRITDSSRSGERNGGIVGSINTGTTQGQYNRFLNMTVVSGATAGGALTNTQTNACVNFNYPMMTGTNFNYTDPTKYQTGNGADQSNRECVVLEAYIKQATASTVTTMATFTTYAATGVDFNCLWWLCCPTLDYYVAIPTAA